MTRRTLRSYSPSRAHSTPIFWGTWSTGPVRPHVIANDSFNRFGKGVSLAPNITGDRDASGTLTYETFAGKVVTVTYAFDNSPTLGGKKVCTVYGSYVVK